MNNPCLSKDLLYMLYITWYYMIKDDDNDMFSV